MRRLWWFVYWSVTGRVHPSHFIQCLTATVTRSHGCECFECEAMRQRRTNASEARKARGL